jgi:MFS family permease
MVRQHLNSYRQFVAANLRFLGFGFVILLASSVGQTYFIGIFGPSVRAEFGLSHTSWSAVYMGGTLMSAFVLPWTGQIIDRVKLQRYATFVIIALGGACLFMAFTPSVAMLVVAIFALRHTGQGLANHTGGTAMARYFPADRGKAVALASLAHSLGGAVLPILMVLSIAYMGWRTSYGLAAVACLVLILPLALWLLRGHGVRHERYELDQWKQQSSPGLSASWSRREVLRDLRFYLLLPAAMAPACIGTGLFFHHLALAEMKGWDVVWFSGSYWVYSTGSVLTSLAIGPLIDRLSAVRVLPMFLLPTVLALVIVWAFSNAWWAWPYLFCIGVTSGFLYSGITALWAEIYGVENLGAIKSLFHAMAVFATALGPLIMGIMMDYGISIENICLIFAVYCLLASWLFMMTLKRYHVISN